MTRAPRSRSLLIAALLVASISATFAAGGAARLRQHWSLDIDRALAVLEIKPGMIVGEAGAGSGYFTLPLAERVGPSGAVYANDISRTSLDTLADKARRQKLSNIHIVEGTTEDAQFPRQDLEMIVLVHAFHDFDKPVEWLENARKYLRPGGTVAVIDLDPEKGASNHFWTRGQITGHATAAGYRTTRIIDDIPRYQIIVLAPTAANHAR